MLTVPKTPAGSYRLVTKSFIATMDLFKGIPPAALQEIEGKMVEKKYPKGSSIFLEGDPAESIWFVKEGHVKAVSHAPNGRCQTLCMVGTKGMFGSCCGMGGTLYPCNSVAESDVTVISFRLSDFLRLMDLYPSISRAVVADLSKRLRDSKGMQTFEQESVEKRILHVLLNMMEEFGSTIPLTRKEIAEMAGTTVETSIRTFSKLEEEGLVSTARGRITVRSEEDLKGRLEME